jgi:hypothetical protein
MPCKGSKHKPICECPIGNRSFVRKAQSETLDMFQADFSEAKTSSPKVSRPYRCLKCGVFIRLSRIRRSEFTKYFEVNGDLRRHRCAPLSKLRLSLEAWEKEGWYRATIQTTNHEGMPILQVDTMMANLNGRYLLSEEAPEWIRQQCVVLDAENNDGLILIDGIDLANQRIDHAVFAIRLE